MILISVTGVLKQNWNSVFKCTKQEIIEDEIALIEKEQSGNESSDDDKSKVKNVSLMGMLKTKQYRWIILRIADIPFTFMKPLDHTIIYQENSSGCYHHLLKHDVGGREQHRIFFGSDIFERRNTTR